MWSSAQEDGIMNQENREEVELAPLHHHSTVIEKTLDGIPGYEGKKGKTHR